MRKMTVAIWRTWVKGTRKEEEEWEEAVVVVVVVVEGGGAFLRSEMMTFMPKAVQRPAIFRPVRKTKHVRIPPPFIHFFIVIMRARRNNQHTNSSVPNDTRNLLPARPRSLARRVQHTGDQAAPRLPLVWSARREIIDDIVHRDYAAPGCKILANSCV